MHSGYGVKRRNIISQSDDKIGNKAGWAIFVFVVIVEVAVPGFVWLFAHIK
jgi:hypothetical protein